MGAALAVRMRGSGLGLPPGTWQPRPGGRQVSLWLEGRGDSLAGPPASAQEWGWWCSVSTDAFIIGLSLKP